MVVYVVCFLRWGVDFSKATFLCGGHIAFLFDLSVYVSENVVLHSKHPMWTRLLVLLLELPNYRYIDFLLNSRLLCKMTRTVISD